MTVKQYSAVIQYAEHLLQLFREHQLDTFIGAGHSKTQTLQPCGQEGLELTTLVVGTLQTLMTAYIETKTDTKVSKMMPSILIAPAEDRTVCQQPVLALAEALLHLGFCQSLLIL